MFKYFAFLSMTTLALALTFGCGGGGDDGDGGQLSASEEEEVLGWFTQLSAVGQAIENSVDSSSGNPMVGMSAMMEQLSTVEDPPRVSDSEVDQALQDFHAGIATIGEAMSSMAAMMSDPSAAGQMMQQMTELQTTMQEMEARMTSAAQTLQRVFTVDFGDNPEAMAQIRSAFGGFDIPTSGMNSAPSAANPAAAGPGKN